jgi:hypothetical protein
MFDSLIILSLMIWIKNDIYTPPKKKKKLYEILRIVMSVC